jgi:hypothetical protein
MHVYYLLQPLPTSDHTFDTAVSSANPSTRWASPPPDRREEFFAAAGPASHSYTSTPRPTAQTMKPQLPLPALSHNYAGATHAPDDGVQDTRLRQVARRRHVDNLGDMPARRKPSAFQSNGASDPKPVSSPSSTLCLPSILGTQGSSSEGVRPFGQALVPFDQTSVPFIAHERGGLQSQLAMWHWLGDTMDRIFRKDQEYRIPYTHKGHLVLPFHSCLEIKEESPPSSVPQRPREAGPDARAIWAAADSRAGLDPNEEQGRWEPKTTGFTSCERPPQKKNTGVTSYARPPQKKKTTGVASYERPPQKRKSREKDDICASSTPPATKAATQRALIPLWDFTPVPKRVRRISN